MNANIAISGMSCITGLGEGLNLWLKALLAERRIPVRINPEMFQDDIDGIEEGPHEMHRVEKIVAGTFLRALRDAALTITENNANRIAVLFGNTYGVEEFKANFYKIIKTNEPALTSPSFFPWTTANSISAKLSILLGIKGMNVTFSSGSTSSSEAVLAACDVLSSGRADTVIVGGENFFCDDFDKEFYACGFRQECCAALVLERKQSIIDSGRKLYACLEECGHGFLCGQTGRDDNRDSGSFIERKLIENIGKKKGKEDIRCVIIHQGNSFYERTFISADQMKHDSEGRLFLSLEALFGNTFSASGILGIILSSLLIEGKGILGIDRKKNDFQKVLFVNRDSYGSYVSTVISGKQKKT